MPHHLMHAFCVELQAPSIGDMQHQGLLLSVLVVGCEEVAQRAAWSFWSNSLHMVIPQHLRGCWTMQDCLYGRDHPSRALCQSKLPHVDFPMVVHQTCTTTCVDLGTYVFFRVTRANLSHGDCA